MGGKHLRNKHLRCSGGIYLPSGSVGDLFIMAPLTSARSFDYLPCEHGHKKPQQKQHQLYQIPAKLVSLNELGQTNGVVECSECHMRRIGRISPDRFFGKQPQVIRCPVCEAHSREAQDNRITTTTASSSTSSSFSDTEDAAFTRPTRQTRARYSNHYVTRTSAPSGGPVTLVHERKPSARQTHHQKEKQITYTRCDEQAIIQLNLIKGKNWNHEPVQLVYESRPREPTHRSPSPPHRSNLALQQMRRLDSEMHPTRMNGASRIIYASKPDTPAFRNIPIRHASPPKGNAVGFRQDITTSSSSESISTSISSLPQGPPIRTPDIELDVTPPTSPRPFDNRAPYGNRIKFETTRPADVPYFGGRIPPQPRIGYQEEELIPRQRSTKDPDLNLSFNFQCGADPHVPPFTPETSFGTQGPTPNIKIQGRSKTGDVSTTTLPTDTPIGGNALDDTLETVGSLQLPVVSRDSSPPTPPALILPALNEEAPVTTLQNGTARRQDRGESALRCLKTAFNGVDHVKSGYICRATAENQVFRRMSMKWYRNRHQMDYVDWVSGHMVSPCISISICSILLGDKIRAKDIIQEMGPSVRMEGDILMPSQQPLRVPKEDFTKPPPSTPPLARSADKVEPNGRIGAPLPSQNVPVDNVDPQFDLSKQVSVQVGSLIQQRLKELTECLNMDSQPVSRGNVTTGAGNARNVTSLQPRIGARAMVSIGWKDEIDSPYQNLSTDKGTGSFVGGRHTGEVEARPGLQRPPQTDFGAPFAGSGKGGSTHPIQRGESISQRMKELMASSGGGGDSRSVTSSGTGQ
ncbi:unnamed protein product [Taenia asiatica]|uniref:ZZ-type domain-containing protein n=1 Tax=Taenia asiatica TaxID=60517 RepID=A0A158R9V8_TAEAS|nr:unnamed protein product [Taenia asiatica]